MLTIGIILDPELAELPPARWRDRDRAAAGPIRVIRRLKAPTSVKDLLESIGIPHCEIGTVRSEGQDLPLDRLLDRDLVLEATGARPAPLPEPRFICDQHLGALARRLRMLGFDTTWQGHLLEPEIARRALNEKRVVLSRNRGLLKRSALPQAMLVRSQVPDRQAVEVLRRFDLAGRIELFGRCTRCNGQVMGVEKARVRQDIPPRTRAWLDEFFQCRQCGQLYWEGTHVQRVRLRLDAIIRQAADPEPGPIRDSSG